MRQDEFQRRAKQWLSTYEREVLRVEEDGVVLGAEGEYLTATFSNFEFFQF